MRPRPLTRHAPPPGPAFGPPDDRLRRGIQYSAASRFKHYGLWNDRPVRLGQGFDEATNSKARRSFSEGGKPGDDDGVERENLSAVVPANAGTHNHRGMLLKQDGATARPDNRSLW